MHAVFFRNFGFGLCRVIVWCLVVLMGFGILSGNGLDTGGGLKMCQIQYQSVRFDFMGSLTYIVTDPKQTDD